MSTHVVSGVSVFSRLKKQETQVQNSLAHKQGFKRRLLAHIRTREDSDKVVMEEMDLNRYKGELNKRLSNISFHC